MKFSSNHYSRAQANLSISGPELAICPIIYLFVYSFSKYILSVSYLIDTRYTTVMIMNKISCPHGTYFIVRVGWETRFIECNIARFNVKRLVNGRVRT